MEQLVDKYGRHITYVRISLTDRCNYRCQYCMPEEGVPSVGHDAILHYEEVFFLLKAFWDMGIEKARFTGGEVFVRRGFVDFLREAKELLPAMRFTLTTNGHFLAEHARDLKLLGLSGVNVSIDSINAEKFAYITRCGSLEKVLSGVDAAIREDLPVKINTVIIKGFNDSSEDVNSLVEYAGNRGITLRFIEFMPLDDAVWGKNRFISSDEIFSRIHEKEQWVPLSLQDHSAGPAQYYCHNVTKQKIGIIAAVSHHFCHSCNRLRVTATGEVKPCLFSEKTLSLQEALEKRDPELVYSVMQRALQAKPDTWQHILGRKSCHMSSIGG